MCNGSVSLEFSINSVFKQNSAFEKIREKISWKFLTTDTVNAFLEGLWSGFLISNLRTDAEPLLMFSLYIQSEFVTIFTHVIPCNSL